MSAEDLIASLQGGLTVDSEGSFTLHREKAREKLRTFQVAEPQKYVLHLVALAALKGASEVHVRIDSDDVVVRFDGLPVTAADLDDLYGASFSAARTDVQRARQQLAVAIHAALALNPRWVRVTSGAGEAAVSMVARHGAPDEIGGAAPGAPPGTEIHVKQRFRPGLMVRFVQHLRGSLAEATWLRERCRFAARPIFVNGEKITAGMQLPGSQHGFQHRDGPSHGVAGLLPTMQPAVVRLVRHGVWLHDEPAPHLPLGFAAVIADDLLLTDLSGDKVVQDDQHARCMRLAAALATAVTGSLVGPQETPMTPELAQRLDPVWRRWKAALAADTGIGRVVGRVVHWPDIFGRQYSLAALRAVAQRVGHLPFTYATAFGEQLTVGDEVVVQRVRGEPPGLDDAILQEVFGEALRDVTQELERRAKIEANRRRWRAQPAEATLNAASYHLTAPFEVNLGGARVTGQVGLRRAPTATCNLQVVVDGCLLAELAMAAPIAGIDAVIGGPLPIKDDFSGPVAGELLAACLGAWLAAAQVLAETGLRRGLIDGWPAELRRQVIHGYLRSLHRGEAVRAVLSGAGYADEERTAQTHHLLRTLPPHAVPKELHAEPWLRGAHAFATARGETLDAPAIGTLLAQGVAVKTVVDQPGHPRIEAPVLRVSREEVDALRWLFGAKLPTIKPDEYAALLARAQFLDRPEATDLLPAASSTPHVVVERAGLVIGAAFVRTAAQWDEAWSRRRVPTQVIALRRALCEVWVATPVPGMQLTVAGADLTIKPTWDGVLLDLKFAAMAREAGAVAPALVGAAIAALPGERDEELRAAWQRGLIGALTATFPTPELRAAYAGLVATHGRASGEQHYLRLLALAQTAGVAKLDAFLAAHLGETELLGDTPEVARVLGTVPRADVDVAALATGLAELRAALGQVGGDSWLADVGQVSPAVASLPLLRRADGAWVTLAQVAAQMEGRVVCVVVDPRDCEWPHQARRPRMADERSARVLRSLYDEARLRVPESADDVDGAGGTAADLLRIVEGLHARAEAPRVAARLIPGLIGAAIAAVQVGGRLEEDWLRGLVLALGATFPLPILRRRYVEMVEALGAAEAERLYWGVMIRARTCGMDDLRTALERATPAKFLEEVKTFPRVDAETDGLRSVLAAIRQALGQVGGDTLTAAVSRFAPEVARLPLFERIDGSPVTLAEAAAATSPGPLYVFSAEERERPRAYLKSLRVMQPEIYVLSALFGREKLSAVAPPPDRVAEPEPKPAPTPEPAPRPKPPLPVDALTRSLRGEDEVPQASTSPEWVALLKLAQLRDADEAPRPSGSREDEAPMSETEAATAMLRELRPTSGPMRGASPVKRFEPPKPAEPTPAERLIGEIQGELHALRRGHEQLLTGFNLDHVRAVPGSGRRAVRCERDGVVIDPNNRLIADAIAGYKQDRMWISFLVSQVYTALNVWREEITDAHEVEFHARHLGWLRERARGGD